MGAQKYKNETQKNVDFRGNNFCIFFFVCAPLCVCVCVCVFVFFPFILDIKFVGRTSRGHTGFLIHLLSGLGE